MRAARLVGLVALIGCGTTAPDDGGPSDAGPPPAPFVFGTASQVSDVAVDERGNVYALTTDGSLFGWRADGVARFAPISVGAVPMEGRHALVGLDDGVAVSAEGRALRYTAEGALRWSVPVAGSCAAARGTDGTIAVAGRDEIVVLDETTGEAARSLAAPGPCAPTDGATLLVAGAREGAYAVAPPLRVYTQAGELVGGRLLPLRELHGLAVAPDGTIGVAGVYERGGPPDFPGLADATQLDPVVLVYEADGTPRTAVSFQGPDFEYAYGLDADAQGFLVAGHFGEFGNGLQAGPFPLAASSADRDAFVARVTLGGTVRWAISIAGHGVVAREVASYRSGRFVVGGLLFPGPLEPLGLAPVEGGGFVLLGEE